MNNKKIIDGQEYHQIPVDKVYIDGIAFGSTFTTEELLAAKKIERASSTPLPSPTENPIPMHTPILSSSSLHSELPSNVSKEQKKSITINKNLFIASIFLLIGTIVFLIFLLL
ncbi:MAG: hypothetical protein ACRC1P_04435 [Cellulosilyticaceae bacterium]